jgi:uncharacterized protein YjdB
MKRVLFAAMLVLGSGVTTACKVTERVLAPTTPIDSVVSVTTSPAAVSLVVGAQAPLLAFIKNARGDTIQKTVTWTSTDPTKATVSNVGVITALAAGTTIIKATVDGVVGQTAVAVSEASVSTVTVSSVSNLFPGQTATPTVTLRGANNQVLTNRFISWGTSNASVATVNGLGTITAVGAGTATIIATSEGKTGAITVNVVLVPVSNVTVSIAAPVYIGRGTQANLLVYDASNAPLTLTGRTVVWSSSDPSKVTVSSTGLITGLSTGAVTVVALVEGKIAALSMVVDVAPIDSISITPSTLTTLGVGITRQFTATAFDHGTALTNAELAGRIFFWSSETPDKVAISTSGLAVGAATGPAAIRATLNGVVGRLVLTITN